MVVPNYYLCDICGEKLDPKNRLSICTGYSPCPAGGPSEADIEYLDLCEKHLADGIWVLLRENHSYNIELGRSLLKWAKEVPRKKS